MKEETSMLAQGGALLSGFAALGAIGLLFVFLFLTPNPVLLVLKLVFAFLAPAGAILAYLGSRGASRWFYSALVCTLTVWLGVAPLTLTLGLSRFRAYRTESRQAQAEHNLAKIKRDFIAWAREGRRAGNPPLSNLDTDWVPAGVPSGKRYRVDPSIWTVSPWRELSFMPTMAHFHQYRFETLNDGSARISARADLDGDGEFAVTTVKITMDERGKVLLDEGPERVPADAF